MGKWVQLLKEIAPGVTRVAVIFNPGTAPFATFFNQSIEAAAPSFGITVTLAPVRDDAEIEEFIAAQARDPGGGLIDLPESFSVTHRNVIAAAAIRHGADLIVVAANPLEDITNVRRLQLVLKEGRVVSDKRHLSGAVP
jgi:putative ABC transport system substrate-binding protein